MTNDDSFCDDKRFFLCVLNLSSGRDTRFVMFSFVMLQRPQSFLLSLCNGKAFPNHGIAEIAFCGSCNPTPINPARENVKMQNGKILVILLFLLSCCRDFFSCHFAIASWWSPVGDITVQCVAVCCSVLQCVALYCSALQCSVVQCGLVWCSVLQRLSGMLQFHNYWSHNYSLLHLEYH